LTLGARYQPDLAFIIDPPGNIFPYLALSAGLSPAPARTLAWQACLSAFLILALFIVVGRLILQFFGITLPALQIAGGLVLFRIAIDMLEGRGHFDRIDTASSLNAADYREVPLVPLAFPLLSGPSISVRFDRLFEKLSGRWPYLIVMAPVLLT
jgi:multiple antibiotic resistance protein